MRAIGLAVALAVIAIPAGAVDLDVALGVPCGAYLALGRSALADEIVDPIQSDMVEKGGWGRGATLSPCVLDAMATAVCRDHPGFTMREVVAELGRLRARHALPKIPQCGA